VIADFLSDRVEMVEQLSIGRLASVGEHPLERSVVAVHQRDAKNAGHGG
jgi:hypothetical protein